MLHYAFGIRDEGSRERFDVVFTTLCLHHLSRAERGEVLAQAHATLRRRGRFIHGGIFKPAMRWEEQLLRERWRAHLRAQGLSRGEAAELLAKRRHNLRSFDTLDGHRLAWKAAGVRRVVCPWTCEMTGLFVGFC